jgi:hypothetical protein
MSVASVFRSGGKIEAYSNRLIIAVDKNFTAKGRREIMVKINGKKTAVTLFVIAVLMVSTLGIIAPKVHAQTPLVSIVPASINDPGLGPGSTIQINATGTDFVGLYTWQVTVFFDPSILSCTAMVVPTGSIFNLPISVSPIIDNVFGSASIGASLVTGSVSGSDVFTTVTFDVIGRGTSDLTFGAPRVDTFFLDPNLADIDVTTQGGVFNNYVAPPTANIFVNPAAVVNPSLTVNQTFDVSLSIQSGTDVQSWAADIFFNNTLLSAVDGVEGSYLSNVGATTFSATVQNDFNATHGRIQLSCALASGGANGDGDLATVTFMLLSSGSTPLILGNVDLRDSQGTLMPFTTADGFFSNITIRDVAVEDVSTFNTVIAQGFPLNVTVVVINNGDNNETFSVGVYADSDLAASTQLVEDLAPGEMRTLEFLWETTLLSLGNHTLSARAEILSGEVDTANNIFEYGSILVIFPGDVNQDGIVDMRDVGLIAQAFNAFYDNGRFNPYADLDGNGRVDLRDIGIWGVNFGQEYTLP